VTAKGQDPVKAIVQDRFGPPDVLRLSDTGLPEAGPDDVLVRVHAAALNPADWHIVRGDPLVARLMGVGLTRPKARDVGQVTAGQRVLVNGAGGGVGSYAVQIAAALGAEVTGVCSTRNVELVRSIGAAHVIDYTTDDFTGGRARYEVILDNVSSLPLTRLRRALTPKGTLVLNGGGSPSNVFGPVAGIVRAVVANAFVSQRLRPLPSRQNRAELLAVTGLIEDGQLMPVVDRTYPLADTAEGLRYVEQGHARGKAVITVA
jgi:NADPH:quinone reductase-like Zn-dependent oxidoreductase